MITSATHRLEALKKLLSQGEMSTQEELVEKLEKFHFQVTQSTVSRDLRKLGAMKAIDPFRRTVYKLSETADAPILSRSLKDHIMRIEHNESTIVIQTSPGSASLVARHLDRHKPGGILGTIAGDDTIFIAPSSARAVKLSIQAIEKSFEIFDE